MADRTRKTAAPTASPIMASTDPYRILQVDPSAEREVIEAAYRALARKYHPDVNRTPDAEHRIREINEAYAVLHDDARRASLDATRSGPGAARPAPVTDAELRARLTPDRPIDLYRAALADTWQGFVGRIKGQGSAAEGGRPTAGGSRVQPAFLVAAVVFGAVAFVALGARALPAARGGDDRAFAAYWRVAATAKADVEVARQRYVEVLGGESGPAAYQAAIANPVFPNVATQFAAELNTAMGRLKEVSSVPRTVEAYHFQQLDDWREERALRLAYRDAAVTRNPDLWAQTTEREAAWRASARHHRTEALAWQLAARVK
ncbi:MAG: DnaJ domain-containing protein [Chloroflexi bacterium]|nr:DnaJ domain-containing protein [Chloroflexota bacterium]